MRDVLSWSILLVVMACGRPKPAVAEPHAATAARPSAATPATDELPAGVVASVDGKPITYDELVHAYELEVLGREVELPDAEAQRILSAVMDGLVYRALLLAEHERLGLDDQAREKLVAEAQARLAMVPFEHHDAPTTVGGGQEFLAFTLALARGAHVANEATVADAYERRKHERTSSNGWARLELLELGYVRLPAGTTGVAECDELLLRWETCARAPGTQLDRKALEQFEAMVRESVHDADRRRFTALMCSSIQAELAAEGGALIGCEWEKARPNAATLGKGRAATRKRAAALQRRASATAADFTAIASQDPELMTRTVIVAIDELEPELARAVAKLEPARVTGAIAGTTGWTIARVRERWPAGPAPLELRHDELADGLVAAQLNAALDGLYERLRASHRVVVRLPPPPKLSPRH